MEVREGKDITVWLVNGDAVGTVVNCADGFLVLSTRFSSKQYIAVGHITSFRYHEDVPEGQYAQ